MRTRQSSAHEFFNVKIEKPKHISSFNMDPTDNVIQLGWNFLIQNDTLAVSLHPTKRLIAVLTKHNCFKIFTFDGYFVTSVNFSRKIIYSSIRFCRPTNTSSKILLLQDIIIIFSFKSIAIYTDNEIEQSYGVPLYKPFYELYFGDYKPPNLKHSDENRYFYERQIRKSNPIHIFIPDQTSFDEFQLFSIKQDTMIVIPRAEICDEVYRIYRMSISDGKILAKHSIDKLPTVEGYPHCVSIDSTMHVYILTPFSDAIQILSPEGGTADIQVPEYYLKKDIDFKKFREIDTFQLLTSLFLKLFKISAPFQCNFEKNLEPDSQVSSFPTLNRTSPHLSSNLVLLDDFIH